MNKNNLEETKKDTGVLNADLTNVAIMNTDVESKTATQLNNSSNNFTDFTDKITGGLTNADINNVNVMNSDVESKTDK